MRMRSKATLAALVLVVYCAAGAAAAAQQRPDAAEKIVVLKAPRVIDGVSSKPIADGMIVVRGSKIEAVGPAANMRIPPGAEVIDLPGHTLLPGLIDSHDHPTLRADSLELKPMIDQRMEPDGKQMLRAVRNMRISLLAGTTTVRVTGESRAIDLHLAKAIHDGMVPGPRVIGAGMPIVPTSGGEGPLWAVDGADAIRKRIRENVMHGAHFTKMYLADTSPTTTSLSTEEIRAAVDESHRLGIPVTAHVVGNWGSSIRIALDCGVDAFEHVRPLSDEMIELFVKHKSRLSITPIVFIAGGVDWSKDLWRRLDHEFTSVEQWIDYNRTTLREARRKNPAGETEDRPFDVFDVPDAVGLDYTPGIRPLQAQLLKAMRRGIPLASGTDSLHGTIQLNVEFLVDGGFTPMEAIQASTRVAAEVLGPKWAARIGTLEPGKLADIIAVEGDPLVRITDLSKVRFVMVEGRRYDRLSFH